MALGRGHGTRYTCQGPRNINQLGSLPLGLVSVIAGAVAESMGRRWVSIGAQWEYAIHSIGRFESEAITAWDKDLSIVEVDDDQRSAHPKELGVALSATATAN